jgi:hypothetical protein
MNIYEIYITAVSVWLIVNGLLTFVFPKIINLSIFRNKSRKFILIRLFGTSSKETWWGFYLSLLWLSLQIAKYFGFIKYINSMIQ